MAEQISEEEENVLSTFPNTRVVKWTVLQALSLLLV